MSDRTVTRIVKRMFWVAVVAFVICAWIMMGGGTCMAGEWRAFLNAVRQVESGGDDAAVGDSGSSRGPMQCGRAAWADAREYLGVDWDYDRCVWLRFESEIVFIGYTQRWDARTWEERARCWNSGPQWRKKYRLTDGYWRRVRRTMQGACHDNQTAF